MARGARKVKSGSAVGEKDVSLLALSLFDKVREINEKHPPIARSIDRLERDIRRRLESIQKQIRRLRDRHDRDLVTVLVITSLHRTADEVLLDHKSR